MGTMADAQWRCKVRVDSERIHNYIKTARKWIFERGFGPESAAVERLLEPLSLVPVQVRVFPLAHIHSP